MGSSEIETSLRLLPSASSVVSEDFINKSKVQERKLKEIK